MTRKGSEVRVLYGPRQQTCAPAGRPQRLRRVPLGAGPQTPCRAPRLASLAPGGVARRPCVTGSRTDRKIGRYARRPVTRSRAASPRPDTCQAPAPAHNDRRVSWSQAERKIAPLPLPPGGQTRYTPSVSSACDDDELRCERPGRQRPSVRLRQGLGEALAWPRPRRARTRLAGGVGPERRTRAQATGGHGRRCMSSPSLGHRATPRL